MKSRTLPRPGREEHGSMSTSCQPSSCAWTASITGNVPRRSGRSSSSHPLTMVAVSAARIGPADEQRRTDGTKSTINDKSSEVMGKSCTGWTGGAGYRAPWSRNALDDGGLVVVYGTASDWAHVRTPSALFILGRGPCLILPRACLDPPHRPAPSHRHHDAARPVRPAAPARPSGARLTATPWYDVFGAPPWPR